MDDERFGQCMEFIRWAFEDEERELRRELALHVLKGVGYVQVSDGREVASSKIAQLYWEKSVSR